MDFTFPKSQRLTGKKEIDAVYNDGKILKKYPFVVKYLRPVEMEKECLKGVFAVPKRRIPRAVKRNRIRRMLKEAYRLNKHLLEEALGKNKQKMALFFVYTGKENVTYHQLEEKIRLILKELSAIVSDTEQ